MSIGVALVGSGIFATVEHLPAIKASPNLTLKAIYSRSLKSAQELSTSVDHAVDLYSNDSGTGKTYHDLLLRDDIHAVIIALPIKNQPEYIEAALAAGKHVLSEKPIAENLHDAERLLKYYNTKIDRTKIIWAVAENFRFHSTYPFAASEIQKLGRILSFKTEQAAMVEAGNKYFETEWRKVPTHQGGFLLDGGVHFVAGIRTLLGVEAAPRCLSAYTAQLQGHLPPVDTIYSVWRTRSGVVGSFSSSFGTTFKGLSYDVACEKGTVSVAGKKVVVKDVEGKVVVEKEFPEQGSGVTPEVAAWAEGIVAGKANASQSPEEGLADLELVEGMLKSGGRTVELKYQL